MPIASPRYGCSRDKLMSPRFLAITQRLLTNRRHPISQPKVCSTTSAFFEQHKTFGRLSSAQERAHQRWQR